MNDVLKDIERFVEKKQNQVIENMRKMGKKIVEQARMKTKQERGFGNITWNLRESIGYVIMKDHAIIESYFPPVGKATEGKEVGLRYATDIAKLIDDGELTLVICAGMEYAYFVESKGYDVISGSCEKFEQEFIRLLKQ